MLSYNVHGSQLKSNSLKPLFIHEDSLNKLKNTTQSSKSILLKQLTLSNKFKDVATMKKKAF